MAWASSSTWKYSTAVQPFSWRIVVPLISWRAQISLPSTKIAWSGETSRSVCGMLSANAPRWMRIGATVSGRGCAVRSIRRRPIHFTGCAAQFVARQREDDVALQQAFDHPLAGGGQDARAGGVADHLYRIADADEAGTRQACAGQVIHGEDGAGTTLHGQRGAGVVERVATEVGAVEDDLVTPGRLVIVLRRSRAGREPDRYSILPKFCAAAVVIETVSKIEHR